MTVRYLENIATNSSLAGIKLLFRYFEALCFYCDELCRVVPIGFVLGFFIDTVIDRWWKQYRTLPWPDEIAMLLCAVVNDDSDDECIYGGGKHQIQKILKYLNLTFAICLRDFSATARKRFPVMQSILAEGLITKEELKEFEASGPNNRSPHVIQLTSWAIDIVHNLEASGHIRNSHAVELLIRQILKYRGDIGMVTCFDWISVPLVYTQLATISVYAYLFASLFALQSLDEPAKSEFRSTITVFKVLFYLCWLKVAEGLINPFGEDDDDFEIDRIIDRNLKVTDFITEELFESVPPLSRGVVLEPEFEPSCDVRPLQEFRKPSMLLRRQFSKESTVLFMGSAALMQEHEAN
nr:bestrophin 1 [Hymenolepis microstoma]